MFRFVAFVFAGGLSLALLAGTGTSQDTKKPDGPPEVKKKGYLPAGWKKLNLSKDQVKKIYGIQTDYRTKIRALEEQIKELRHKEHVTMVGVLTDKQKAKLLEGLVPSEKKKTDGEKSKSDK